jgi:hypothetical protein
MGFHSNIFSQCSPSLMSFVYLALYSFIMQKPITSNQEEDKDMSTVERKLKYLGIPHRKGTPEIRKANQQRLLGISTWSNEDLKEIEETRRTLNAVRPLEW